MALEDDLVRDYRKPGLLDLWENARRAVELDRPSFGVRIGDLTTLTEVSGLLGVHSPTTPSRRRLRIGSTPRITLDELDARLASSRYRVGLRDLLDVVLATRVVSREERRHVLHEAFARKDLDDRFWLDEWLEHTARPGLVDGVELHALARTCASVISALHLDPRRPPVEFRPLSVLAELHTGDPKALNPRSALGLLVIRAAALAYGQDVPTTTIDRWTLWRRCGVLTSTDKTWDVFVSHAGQDKEAFARPLVKALIAAGLRVWFDEFTLVPGDSLRESIDRGLATSHAGILVCSEHFFDGYWPKQELNGLFALRGSRGTRLIPILHGMTHDRLTEVSPMIADSVALKSTDGLDHVVRQVLRAVHRVEQADA